MWSINIGVEHMNQMVCVLAVKFHVIQLHALMHFIFFLEALSFGLIYLYGYHNILGTLFKEEFIQV